MDDFEIGIARDSDLRSVLELRTKFFKYHTEKDGKLKRGIDPIALVLSPPKYVDESDPFATETWYAVYHKNFYVTIEQSHVAPISGPHKAQLHIQIYPGKGGRPGKHEWLGTATFSCVFTSEERIRIALRRAIRTREYFVGEKVEEMLINMNPPEENITYATV